MLHCLSFKSSSSSSPATTNVNAHPAQSQAGTSTDGTPRSGSHALSPTVNLSREYIQAVQTSSYNEMWSKIHVLNPYENSEEGQVQDREGHVQLLLDQILQPNKQCVDEALSLVKVNALTSLVKSYFDHSERSSRLCLLLHQSIHRARILYAPLHALLDALSLGRPLSQPQCDRAFDVFLEFDLETNPFPSSGLETNPDQCFLRLKHQLDRESRSRARLIRTAKAGSAICLIGTVVGVAVSAAVITAHALGLLAAAPLCCAFARREVGHVAQLEAAARGAFVLLGELETIERLVVLLYDAVEDDKKNVKFALERGRDKHPVREVLRLLCKNRVKFVDQMRDLEERICLCFATVNRARSLLLEEVVGRGSG